MAHYHNFPSYDLRFVPTEARTEIAKVFDIPSVTGITMEHLAEKLDKYAGYKLGFDNLTLAHIRTMSQSPTLKMLFVAETKGVNTNMLQRAIVDIGTAVDNVLPTFLPEIEARYKAFIRNQPGTGSPCLSPCSCNQCMSQDTSHHDRSSNVTLTALMFDHDRHQPPVNIPQVGNSHLHPGDSRCNDPRCVHTNPVRQNSIVQSSHTCYELGQMRNALSSVENTCQRQLSDEDNNRQTFRSPSSMPNFSRSQTAFTQQNIESNDRLVAAPANLYNNCDCKDCQQKRLSSDCEETEYKSSSISSSCVHTVSHNSNSVSSETTTTIPTTTKVTRKKSNKLGSQRDKFRDRSNSDVASNVSDTREGSTRTGSSDSDIPKIHPECTCSRFSVIPIRKNYGVIFVSLAEHSNSHIREVMALCRCLQDIGFEIKCDMMDDLFKKKDLNSHQWIDTWFNNAKYVLFCISPMYHEYISVGTQEEMMYQRENAEPNNNRFHTRYIFDRARSEYINNGSLNYRFIPVVFKNSGASQRHVPEFLHATLWYIYPDSMTHLADFLRYRRD